MWWSAQWRAQWEAFYYNVYTMYIHVYNRWLSIATHSKPLHYILEHKLSTTTEHNTTCRLFYIDSFFFSRVTQL